MAFSFMDGDGVTNLPSFLKIIFSFDILCDKSDFFLMRLLALVGLSRRLLVFLALLTIPQFFLFWLETKQMENNDW